jgi:internalin A
LASFPSLITLNVSQNRIKSLHPVVPTLPPSLMRLNLADNMISYVPSSFASILLLDLDLSGNKLSGTLHVPPIATLRTLKLSRNALISISGLDSLSKLDYLDVSENQLMDVEDLVGIRECDSLGKLVCARNPLSLCPRYRYAMYAGRGIVHIVVILS